MTKLEQAEQEQFDMDDHPPHRLCECRKCMEYFTPLPDCDAFAAFGKPIAEQTNAQFMEGYRIGLAEMREKCAKVVTEHVPTCSPNWVSYVVAIRSIKFEGDTGFRPVSEMIAEHKQDPKKAAAIEKAKMRKAEQEPVSWIYEDELPKGYPYDEMFSRSKIIEGVRMFPEVQTEQSTVKESLTTQEPVAWKRESDGALFSFEVYDGLTPLYAAPVRTKDLTDDEIDALVGSACDSQMPMDMFARAVIAADREKN